MAHTKAPTSGANKPVPPSEKIGTAVKQLAVCAVDIKSAADELSANIVPLDAALAKFDLGVSAWFQITGSEHQDGSYWSRQIGYTKFGKEWGIVLKKVEGHQCIDEDNEEMWFFKDAPRWMQVESVTKIPDLFDALIKRTDDTIKNLKAKSLQAKEIADALNTALAEIAAQPTQVVSEW